MILSHGIKGLLTFEQIPSWGLVPIHLLTKFSSSLFILVFGIALAVVHLPAAGLPAWPSKRRKLLMRGLVVFFWYKMLTIVEMFHLYPRQDVIDTLLYRAFPVYVEILGFYALALLWVPFVLPLWKKMGLAKAGLAWKLSVVAGLAALGQGLSRSGFDFGGNEVLQAILVEHERHYTWGQLSRAPLIFLGLIFGEAILASYARSKGRLLAAGAFVLASALMLGAFFWLASPAVSDALVALAKNEGKHPPALGFVLFSVGGALGILGLTLAGGERLARWLRPVTWIGQDALQSFVCHIVVIFVFYRYLFDLWHSVSYPVALSLTLVLLALTASWVRVLRWVRKGS